MQPLSITELSPRTFCTFSRELSFSRVRMALILALALTLQRLRSFT